MAEKRFLQRVSTIISWLSFIAAIVCCAILLYRGSDASQVFKASFGATTFFFFMVGMVLRTIGETSLPDLTIKDKP